VAGCFTLLSSCDDIERPKGARQTLIAIYSQPSRLLVAAATLMAAATLANVVVHMLAN
jgi:hypothetical protein